MYVTELILCSDRIYRTNKLVISGNNFRENQYKNNNFYVFCAVLGSKHYYFNLLR